MRMRTTVYALAILGLLSAGLNQARAQDTGAPDTVQIDSVATASNTQGSVPVFFFNDELIAGVEVTLQHDSPDIVIDSFSFAGGRLAVYDNKYWFKPIGDIISIFCVPLIADYIPAGSGLMGTLYFSFSTGLDPQLVTIDTITVIIDEREYSTRFSGSLAEMFTPEFSEGFLDIQLGSCCLGDRGNIDGSPDDLVDISDLVFMVQYMFESGTPPDCPAETNVDGSTDEVTDISDLVYLVTYMFEDGPPPPSCP